MQCHQPDIGDSILQYNTIENIVLRFPLDIFRKIHLLTIFYNYAEPSDCLQRMASLAADANGYARWMVIEKASIAVDAVSFITR